MYSSILIYSSSLLLFYIFFFFFSSRRRHTRWPRDWSSDVCSSDLGLVISPNGRIIKPSQYRPLPCGNKGTAKGRLTHDVVYQILKLGIMVKRSLRLEPELL